MSWTRSLLLLADRLPTGRRDPQAGHKLTRERQELEEALGQGDRLGAVLEAGDVAYYAAKCVANGLLTETEARVVVEFAANKVELPTSVVIEVAVVKMSLRARPGNPKDDAAERAAVRELIERSMVKWQG